MWCADAMFWNGPAKQNNAFISAINKLDCKHQCQFCPHDVCSWHLFFTTSQIVLCFPPVVIDITFFFSNFQATHLPLLPDICLSELGQHWFRQWLVAYWAASHYLIQSWVIVNWTLKDKNFNQNTKLFIHENIPENIVCEMTAILSRGKCVKQKNSIIFHRWLASILLGRVDVWLLIPAGDCCSVLPWRTECCLVR